MWYIFEILSFCRFQIKNSKLCLFDEKIEKINIQIALDYLFQIEEVHIKNHKKGYNLMEKTDNVPRKKYISLLPLLAQCRSEMLFFFFFPYTPSLRVRMERRRKKHPHSCTVPGLGKGKCIFSGRIVRFLRMGVFVYRRWCEENEMVFVSHSVPFPATCDRRSEWLEMAPSEQ